MSHTNNLSLGFSSCSRPSHKYSCYNIDVFSYVMNRLDNGRSVKNRYKPLELKILYISKKLNISYSKVRYTIDTMVREGYIEKFTNTIGGNPPYRITRYRLPK